MKIKTLLVVGLCAAFALAAQGAEVSKVQPANVSRYDVFEQTFHWKSAAYSNPWEQVQLTLALVSPSGRTVSVGGFYDAPDTWKARFAPAEIGVWSWQATLTDSQEKKEEKGSFTVAKSNNPGFVRANPVNKFRWAFEDGTPYHPIGIGDCVRTRSHHDPNAGVLDSWGLDGGFRRPGVEESRVPMDTYFKAYSDAGVNLFRWSVDNCAFNLYRTISSGGNVYLLEEGAAGDKLVRKLKEHDLRVYMVLFAFKPPGAGHSGNHAAPPHLDVSPRPNPPNATQEFDAIKRYVKYVVDRYGAYVDFWELMNEASVSDEWYREIIPYLRSVDPYKHPISTSWEKPQVDGIEINSPHWYQKENEFDSDHETWKRFERWKAHGKPVIVGEQGNSVQNWDERSGLRMRLRSWTAFFAEGVLIFWNSSGSKDYKNAGAANIYLGPEERGYLKVLQDFTQGFDARAAITTVQVSDTKLVRAYALTSSTSYAAYLHAYTDHAKPTTGITVTIEPQTAGLATWMEPSTGRVLNTQSVEAGRQTLAVPPFTIDVALKIKGRESQGSQASRSQPESSKTKTHSPSPSTP